MLDHAETAAAQPETLRRAVAFIHDNAHRDIGLSDIAAAISITPRSVQYTFRRHLGTTPLEYLRRVRLDRAHRDLHAADPAVDTVMAIAGRWRFGQVGRFSIAYKEAFGTPPSRTLRHSAGEPRLVSGRSRRNYQMRVSQSVRQSVGRRNASRAMQLIQTASAVTAGRSLRG
jgi:transcriptional regulator GlxA family with amidase domain